MNGRIIFSDFSVFVVILLKPEKFEAWRKNTETLQKPFCSRFCLDSDKHEQDVNT